MNKCIHLFAFFLFGFGSVSNASTNLNIKQFGAIGDGIMLNTEKIQLAIDSCFRQGGGTVLIPKGVFLSGTIVLRSNVTLHLEPDAFLFWSKNLAENIPYADPKHQALIYAFGSHNVSIKGQGIIDGQGQFFEAMSRQESIPVFRGEAVAKKEYLPRPRLIEMIRCENINIQEVQVKNSPSWGVHLIGCESVFIDRLRLDSHVRPNNDGIDIESCKNSLSVANSFLKLEGQKTKDVLMLSNDFRKVNKPYILDKNLSSTKVEVK